MIPYVLGFYALASVIGFFLYGFDKRRARLGGSRVPEARLHLVELLGGWPGALAGQRVFRHKTRKTSFRLVFWLIVLVHVAAWAWYLSGWA
jgi:uncharacterized membrane protein YsdA (DUF1294 family)